MAVIKVRAACFSAPIHLGVGGGGWKIDLRCLSLNSKKLSQKTSLASFWPELGHMATEPGGMEMSFVFGGPWDFQGISFLRYLHSYFIFLKPLKLDRLKRV